MAKGRDIRAGRAFVEIAAEDRLQAGLRAAQQRLRAFGQGVRSIGTALLAAGSAASAPLLLSLRTFASYGDQVAKLARRTGLSTEAVSELGFAAQQSGADLETLEKSVRTLQRTTNDAERGLSTAVDAFRELGLSVEELRALTPDQQLELVADRLSQIEDPGKKAALAMQVLGKAGTQLLPLLNGGAAGIRELREEARRLGLTIDADTALAAEEATDAFARLLSVFKAVRVQVGAAVARVVVPFSNAVTQIASRVIEWVKANQSLVAGATAVAAGIVAAGAAFFVLGAGIGVASFAMGGLATVVGAVGAAISFIASPLGIVASLLAAGAIAFVAYTETGRNMVATLVTRFGEMKQIGMDTFSGIADALAAGDIRLAAEVLWAGIRLAWLTGTQDLNAMWLKVKEFFLRTWEQTVTGVSAALTIGLSAIERGWIETTGAVAKIWARATGLIKSTWESTQAFLAKRFIDIQGLFDKSLDTDAAKGLIDDDSARQQENIAGDQQKALDDAASKLADRRAKLESETEARLAAIGQRLGDAEKNLSDATKASLEERQRSLQEAREALAAFRTQAADEAAKVAARVAGPGGPADPFGLASATGGAGTFNASVLNRLIGSSNGRELEPVVRAQQKTNELIQTTNRLLREQSSPTFA